MNLTSAILPRGDPVEPAAEQSAALDDPLLCCVEYIAEHFGLPFSRGAALARLPLAGARLTPELLARAAEQAGLSAEIVKIPLPGSIGWVCRPLPCSKMATPVSF
jgi:ABC-type bacteriocin/lantibiotic exporter with double-glycine peptidase domain